MRRKSKHPKKVTEERRLGGGGLEDTGSRWSRSISNVIRLGHMLHCLATSWHSPSMKTEDSFTFQAIKTSETNSAICGQGPLPQSPHVWEMELNISSSKRVLGKCTTGFTTSILHANHWRTHFLSIAQCYCSMPWVSETISGEAWSISTLPFQGVGKPEVWESKSQRSPYLEPFTWLGLHSILMVTLAGGWDSQSCWGTRGLILDVCP